MEALARTKVVPTLPVQPEFWHNFAVVMSFGKIVHKAFQALEMAYGRRLQERAEQIARHPADEALLSEFATAWQGLAQYYQGFTARELFEPPAKMDQWITDVDDALRYLQGSAASIGPSIETSARAISDSSGFYQEIKALLAEYPELVQDIADVVDRPRVGAASQLDQGGLRQALLASFDEDGLRGLCSTLEAVDYEDLPGEDQAAKARALVAHFSRADRLPELVAACRALHPDADWPGLLDITYPTQLVTKTRELIRMTRTLALDADCLIQNLVDAIVPPRIGE